MTRRKRPDNYGPGICRECKETFLKHSAAQVTCNPPKLCRHIHKCRHRGSKSVLVPSIECTTCHQLKDVRIYLDKLDIHECADCRTGVGHGKNMSKIVKQRKLCLKCGEKFPSKGDYNRICDACNTINNRMCSNEYSATV